MIRIEALRPEIRPSFVYLNPEHFCEINMNHEPDDTIVRILLSTGEWFEYRTSEHNLTMLDVWLNRSVNTLKDQLLL